jgi:hypothetical protein
MLMTLMYGVEAYILKEKHRSSIVSSKVIGTQVNADKTKYMVMSREQNAGRSPGVKIDNNSFGLV